MADPDGDGSHRLDVAVVPPLNEPGGRSPVSTPPQSRRSATAGDVSAQHHDHRRRRRPTAAGRVVDLARRHPLVLLVMAGQAVAAGRLTASPFQDEALYLATGHWLLRAWSGGAPLLSGPEGWFTGAPQLYPVLAALLDGVGGLGLVRWASTAFLLATTVAVAWAASTVARAASPTGPTGAEADDDARRAAAVAALVLAATGPLLSLGHFATMDAASYACLAWALALGLHACGAGRPASSSVRWAVVAGALLALATLLKYTSGLGVACVLLAVTAATLSLRAPSGAADPEARGAPRWAGLRTAAVAAATGGALLLVSALTWGRGLVGGFLTSTLERQPLMPEPAGQLLQRVLSDAGLLLALAVAGAVVLARRRPLLGLALGLGTVGAVASQVLVGESVSLYKASALGMVLGAPAVGHLAVRLRGPWWGSLVVATALVVAVVTGLGTASRLFGSWPDTTSLTAAVVPLVEARPGTTIAADTPEVLQYPLWRQTTAQQWAATYDGAFSYQGLTGANAFEAAMRDRTVGVVVLDGSTPIGRELAPLVPALGYAQEAQVRSPDGSHTWTVWVAP